MNEIIATISAGLPLTGLVLAVLCAITAYVLIFAFSVGTDRYDLVIIEIIIGVTIFVIVCSYAIGLSI